MPYCVALHILIIIFRFYSIEHSNILIIKYKINEDFTTNCEYMKTKIKEASGIIQFFKPHPISCLHLKNYMFHLPLQLKKKKKNSEQDKFTNPMHASVSIKNNLHK
jgi:hypothetical protein